MIIPILSAAFTDRHDPLTRSCGRSLPEPQDGNMFRVMSYLCNQPQARSC